MIASATVTRKRLMLHKGRRGGDSTPFSMVPVEVLRSDACRTLPHSAFRVLAVLAAQYNGVNNGSLSLTRRTAAEFGIGNAHVLGAALRELGERGLVLQTRRGSRIPPLSAFYAVTWRLIDQANPRDPHGHNATLTPPDDWRRWTTEKRQAHWTVQRRSKRWPRATQTGGAGPQGKAGMGGAGPPKEGVSPVAQGHCSYISGLGAA